LSPPELSSTGYGSDSNIPIDPFHYLSLFDNAPCGYLILGMDGSVVQANAGFWNLVGTKGDPDVRLNFRKWLTSAGSIFFETQLLPTLILNGRRGEIALDLKVENRRIPVLANFALEFEAGVPSQIRVVVIDASERRLFEKDLLRSRKEAEQLSEVILHSSDAIITLRVDGSVRSWNKGAVEMFGYTSLEAIGMPLAQVIASRDGQDFISGAMETLRKGREFAWETVSQRKDGSEVEISVKLTPHMEAPGTLVAFSAIVRDITIQKRSERALLQSEKLASVGRLASSIAHEINNPLAAVTNLLYLLNLQANTPELKSLVETAQDELARVSLIATHTLRFHRQSSRPTDIDLGILLESVVALYRARLRNSSIIGSLWLRNRQLSALAECFGELLEAKIAPTTKDHPCLTPKLSFSMSSDPYAPTSILTPETPVSA